MKAWVTVAASALASDSRAAQESAPIPLNHLGKLPNGYPPPPVLMSAWRAQAEKAK